jgi:hypothetical protein
VKLACASVAAFAAVAVAGVVFAAPSGWLNVDGNIRFAGGGGTVDWANSGPAGAACANGGVNVTGSGGLFNCGRPGAGTAPPIAATLTPAAAADASIISSLFIVDPIKGDTPPCGADTTYSTAAKNGDPVSSFKFTAQAVLAKDDLGNMYAVSHTRADGHPELFFAAERLDNSGDSHIDFEFLQSAIAATGACAGSFTGHRTEGDLLFAVDFTGGGTIAAFTLYQWHCVAEPGPQPADGTVCDPTGVQHYQSLGAPAAGVLSVNVADVPCGGWVCRDKSGVTATIVKNDFVEGAIDLQALPFSGCVHTFWPHTRSAQPFTANVSDFAGPFGFNSCKGPATTSNSSPSGANVQAGSTATDTVNVTNGGAGLDPAGTMTFFLCNPGQVTAGGCVSGGTQVGAVKTIVAGSTTSDPSGALQFNGKWCWRTAFTPDPSLAGVYEPATHTNASSECFSVINGIALPNTGLPDIASDRLLPAASLLLLPATLVALAWRRSRSIALLLVAGVIVGASPSPASPQAHSVSAPHRDEVALASTAASPPALGHVVAREAGWRLVIPRIGVDAQIQPVGVDRDGAMAAPASLDSVGWFNRGPAPGQPGSAVIDGHYGAGQPAVFRALRLLRPGDEIDVVWPDGRIVSFQVAAKQTVAATSHPPDLFTRAGPARLSLITCAGAWIESRRTYSERLIVTATLS